MTRLQGFATLALLACANLSCSAEPQEKTAVEPPHAQSTVAVAIGKQRAIFRKITPEAYKIDYPDFYLLETEVTNRMYREYLRAIGQSKDDTEVLATVRERESKRSETVTSADGLTYPVYRSSTGDTPYSVNDEGMIWRDGEYPAGLDDYPVALVTLDDALSFCDWLTKANPDVGLFRLPTWNEWMIAAFGKSRRYPWGDEWDRTLAHTSYGLTSDDRAMRAEPVKSRSRGRTPEGLFGMIGNVAEYLNDGDPTNAEYFNLGARWMGGGFEDGIPISLKEGDVEQMEPRKDYWGYSHDSGLREDHLGFRVLLDLKKDLRLIDRPRFFPQEDTQWQTDGE